MERFGKMNKVLSVTVAIAAVGALLVTSANDAEAAFKLRLTELGADRVVGGGDDTMVTIQDNFGADENGLAGVITYSQSIGSFMVNVNVGLSKPSLGSVSTPQMHLTNVQLTSLSGGTILIDLTDTGFASASSPLKFVTEFNGAGSGEQKLESYVSTDNGEFSKTGTQIGDFDALGPDQAGYAVVDGEYSIGLFTYVSLDPFSATSFDAVVRVPEPGSLALFGLGLLGLGFLARRRTARHLDA